MVGLAIVLMIEPPLVVWSDDIGDQWRSRCNATEIDKVAVPSPKRAPSGVLPPERRSLWSKEKLSSSHTSVLSGIVPRGVRYVVLLPWHLHAKRYETA
jgi:hypothetical protein